MLRERRMFRGSKSSGNPISRCIELHHVRLDMSDRSVARACRPGLFKVNSPESRLFGALQWTRMSSVMCARPSSATSGQTARTETSSVRHEVAEHLVSGHWLVRPSNQSTLHRQRFRMLQHTNLYSSTCRAQTGRS